MLKNKNPMPQSLAEIMKKDDRRTAYIVTILVLLLPVTVSIGIGAFLQLYARPTLMTFLALAMIFGSLLTGIFCTHFISKVVVYDWGVKSVKATLLTLAITAILLIANFLFAISLLSPMLG